MSSDSTTAREGGKWVWQALGQPPAPPRPVNLRAKAALQAAVMSSVGGFLYWKFPGHRVGAYVIWALASTFLVCGLFIPPAFQAIDRFFFAVLPKWVATGLNWLLLVPFFFLVFVPARLLLAATGKDPMTRRVPTDLPTYWISRKPLPNLDQYKKQH